MLVPALAALGAAAVAKLPTATAVPRTSIDLRNFITAIFHLGHVARTISRDSEEVNSRGIHMKSAFATLAERTFHAVRARRRRLARARWPVLHADGRE